MHIAMRCEYIYTQQSYKCKNLSMYCVRFLLATHIFDRSCIRMKLYSISWHFYIRSQTSNRLRISCALKKNWDHLKKSIYTKECSTAGCTLYLPANDWCEINWNGQNDQLFSYLPFCVLPMNNFAKKHLANEWGLAEIYRVYTMWFTEFQYICVELNVSFSLCFPPSHQLSTCVAMFRCLRSPEKMFCKSNGENKLYYGCHHFVIH